MLSYRKFIIYKNIASGWEISFAIKQKELYKNKFYQNFIKKCFTYGGINKYIAYLYTVLYYVKFFLHC